MAAKTELSEHKVGRVTTIKIRGPLTVASEPGQLSQLVHQHLDAGEYLFTLNLADCERLDSMGVGELVKTHVAISRKQGHLNFSNVPPGLRSILTVTGLTQIIPMYVDETSAINSFGN